MFVGGSTLLINGNLVSRVGTGLVFFVSKKKNNKK